MRGTVEGKPAQAELLTRRRAGGLTGSWRLAARPCGWAQNLQLTIFDIRPGDQLTLALPPPRPQRWVARRKAQVISGVAAGLLTVKDACGRYELTIEEFTSWQRALDRDGIAGLEVTRLKHYRRRWAE